LRNIQPLESGFSKTENALLTTAVSLSFSTHPSRWSRK